MSYVKSGAEWRRDQIAKRTKLVEQVREMAGNGISSAEIAKQLHIPESTVRYFEIINPSCKKHLHL